LRWLPDEANRASVPQRRPNSRSRDLLDATRQFADDGFQTDVADADGECQFR
jgi:hypothetical protein